ncbi:MAG: hypothetical protein IPH07_06585 [Deltaproteobacteria bacterium]|nr:hypothetical protein [Deltaproteobacteria bacterium]MBK8717980.1 hypothetical protein [Deltaproteobacteria bacterium]MBP7290147.1 hypothetical protein [Nannocystaceae bacterium]
MIATISPSLALLVSLQVAVPNLHAQASAPRAAALVEPSGCTPALLEADRSTVAAITKALRDAETKATEDPEAGDEVLVAALDAAADAGALVARDTAAQDARLYALLALARARLTTGKQERATEAMDLAIATSGGRALPVKLFGPAVMALHERRLAIAKERASTALTVTCAHCLVVVEAAPLACASAGKSAELRLAPGSWRVVLVDADKPSITRAATLTLGDIDRARFELAPQATAPNAGAGKGTKSKPPRDPNRKLPRWAGIVGVSLGVVAMIAGGVLLGIDGQCVGGGDPAKELCPKVNQTKGMGAGVLAGGAALAVGFAIPLAIGEKRSKQVRPSTAALHLGAGSVSLRF